MILLANAAPSGSPDPQVNYTLQEWQLLILTHDGLLAFKRVAGKPGTQLVPDLAVSIPELIPRDPRRADSYLLPLSNHSLCARLKNWAISTSSQHVLRVILR